MKGLYFSLAFLFCVEWACAQSQSLSINVDFVFQRAREKAFQGEREEARQLLSEILKEDSTHMDARLFLARCYGWEGKYDQAKQQLNIVLKKDPIQEEALNLLVDLDSWNHDYKNALKKAVKALATYPASASLLYSRASLHFNLKEYKEAGQTLSRLLELYPLHGDGRKLQALVQEKLLRYEISTSVGVDHFSQVFAPSWASAIQVIRKNSWGATSLRANYANRFGQQGVQSELELYPVLSKKTYAYLDYGYSNSILFPKNRIGAELYTSLSHGIEGSLGLRQLDFGAHKKVNMFTTSLGWYKSRYWIMIRPTLISDQTLLVYATSLTIRRYFKDEKSYISMALGTGLLPDERRLQSGVGVNVDRAFLVKSKSVAFVVNKSLPHYFSARLNYDLAFREKTAHAKEYISINTVQVTVSKKF